jgi:integrase/recombinase XerD
MTYCCEIRKMSIHTIKSYEHAVKRFIEFMENTFEISETVEISKKHILAYIRELNNYYAPSSASQHFTIIHVFFDFLEDYCIIEYSPFRTIHEKRIKIPKRLPTTLTIEEICRILAAAYTSDSTVYYAAVEGKDILHYRDCLVLEFLFNTGMRVNELCGLKPSDYDTENGIIRFIGKGNKERKCYITVSHIPKLYKNYMDMRKKYLKKSGKTGQTIFINRFGNALSDQGVRAIVTKYSNAAGIRKNVTPHVFRHSFATLLMEQGVNLRYIQEYLGHETILTTQRYLHINDKAAQEMLTANHPRAMITPETFDEKL